MRASDFYKAVKSALDPMVKPLGFRSRDRFYYRIVNDVVQQFCLLYRNLDFTIRFDVVSVYEDGVLAEGHDIYRLINETNQWLGFRMVQKASGELAYEGPIAANPIRPDLRLCADACTNAVKQYLLPFFDEAVDSESAHRLLHQRVWYWRSTDDHTLCLGFLLGMGEWEQARDALKQYLDRPRGEGVFWNMLWRLYDALDSYDVSYILDYMEKKEAAAYSTLHLKRKVP